MLEKEDPTVKSSDTFESKIQNQFNEEKWTRSSAKNLTISRFQILDDFLSTAKAENKNSELIELSSKHLKDYELSVSSPYFLGMLHLEEEEEELGLEYLQNLLKQFESESKWSVVQELADKILKHQEIISVLKIQANALEKLGRSEPLLEVYKILSQKDKKNPTIALKYADLLIHDDLERGIQLYKQAIESFAKNRQYDALRNVWGKIIEFTPDDFNFFKKIERILQSGGKKDFIIELYVQLANHFIKEKNNNSTIFLCKEILQYNPSYIRFKNELIRAFKEKFQEHSLLEYFLKYSGLLNNKKNVLHAIQNFETNIVFDKEHHVYHRTWGVGYILDINRDSMTVDFDDKKSHDMEVKMALKSLIPLNKDHFLVNKHKDFKQLKDLFENDIVSFFKLLIKSFNGSMTLSDIKNHLIPDFVGALTWSKWWTKTRTRILKDPQIAISSKKRDLIEYIETQLSASDMVIEQFQNIQLFSDKVSLALTSLKDIENLENSIDFMLNSLKEGLASFEFTVRIQVFLLFQIAEDTLPQHPTHNNEKHTNKLIDDLKKMTVQEVDQIALSIKNIDIRKQFYIFIHLQHDEWGKLFSLALCHTPVRLHRFLFQTLIDSKEFFAITHFFFLICKDFKTNAEVFIWLFKTFLSSSNWDVPNYDVQSHLLTFFRLSRVIHLVEIKGSRLKNSVKEILIGNLSDTLFKVVDQEQESSLRKVFALSHDISCLKAPEREILLERIININPSRFQEEELSTSKFISSSKLIETLEAEKKVITTIHAHEQMQQELAHLLKIEMPENSKEIGIAQEKGDLRENAEYKAAMEAQSQLQTRLKKLESQIKNIFLLTSNNVGTDEVGLGNKVRLKNIETDDIFVYSILDQWDADIDRGIISYKSPLGNCLLNAAIKDVVSFEAGDTKQSFKILSINHALDQDGRLI